MRSRENNNNAQAAIEQYINVANSIEPTLDSTGCAALLQGIKKGHSFAFLEN
jgi:hypothetical protein